MKKRKFPIFLVLGIILVVISFSLLIAHQIRVHIASDKCQKVLEKMESLLPERSSGSPELYQNPNMPVLEIDSVDYVALLEIPSLEVSLPVADRWNRDKLFAYPHRFCGSAYNQTLVIGGADYSHQFSFCDKIDQGTTVTVTDMTGTQFTYKVTRVDRSSDAKKQWLTNTDYDLTLFCRDIYSLKYIAVRCNFAYN